MLRNSWYYCVFRVRRPHREVGQPDPSHAEQNPAHIWGLTRLWPLTMVMFLKVFTLCQIVLNHHLKKNAQIILKLIILQYFARSLNHLWRWATTNFLPFTGGPGVPTRPRRCSTQVLRLSTLLDPPPTVVQCTQQRMNLFFWWMKIWFFCGTLVVKKEKQTNTTIRCLIFLYFL